MKTIKLIDEIYFKASIFQIKNHVEQDKIFITISKTNVEKIVDYFFSTISEFKDKNVYGKIKVHGFNVISSEMLTNEEIIIGLIETL